MPTVHAFFDFDDTLLNGDSILFWLRFYYRRRPARRLFKIMGWAGLLLFLLRLIDNHTMKRFFLMPMAFEDEAALDRLGREFVREDLARRFHAPVLQRLWAHHLLGHRIVIISASAAFYLRHLKQLLPMAEILGTEMIWPRGGWWRLPGYLGGNLRGENKIARLKALGFGAEAPLSFAYSDHHHDAFLLRFSEFPVCVRPTAKLRALAAESGWPVWDWPRDRPAWRVKAEKGLLLLFALGREPAGPAVDPLREAAAARDYATAHGAALRERMAMVYPESAHPEKYRSVFGE